MISRQMFTAGALQLADPGEVIFQSAGASNSQTVFSWVVPVGVYEVCMLAISSHRDYATRISRGGADLINTIWSVGANGVGGGNGGNAGPRAAPYTGAGGAGGYSGAGGQGGDTEKDAFNNISYFPGQAGSGGGGGGGWGGDGAGGGVGIYGQGANGAPGTSSSDSKGKAGSDTGLLRAGAGTPNNYQSAAGVSSSKHGGNLRYRNAVPVSPGETLTITLDYWIRDNAAGYGAIVRILWGGARSFPTNAPATNPLGQIVFAGADTSWTVPAGITSLSMCAQQRDGSWPAVSVVAAGSTVLRAQNEARIGDGGGDGGVSNSGGGGGAGGYEGNGGYGGGSSTPNADGEWTGLPGGPGQGGGGNGGAGSSRYKGGASWGGGSTNYISYPSTEGGNTGLSGRNASGTYTDPIEGDSGGGPPGVRGGALAWRNNVAVTPGQVLSINAAGGRVRIIWGAGRSYPNNALKVT